MRHRQILDRQPPSGPRASQRVRQEASVVTRRESPCAGARRAIPRGERRVGDRLGDVEHERQLERRHALGVERAAAILERHVARALLERLERSRPPAASDSPVR
jgi:hypothetical protein